MSAVEVGVGRTWLPLRRAPGCPQVPESSKLRLRALNINELVSLGHYTTKADIRGNVELRLSECKELFGHLGLVEVTRDSGASAGEFEIVPDKTSETAFQALRAALESVWSGLIFDPDGVSRLRGQLPSPHELWRAVEQPVRDIAAEPRSILTRGEGVRRLEAVRKPSELTAGIIRASAAMASRVSPTTEDVSDQNAAGLADWPTRPVRTGLVVREVAIPENALVAETLRRLAAYARRQPDGLTVAALANRALREQPFASCGSLRGRVESTQARTLHDPRYRQITKVLRLLSRPEAQATEGPGEARLGVKGMIRLYEYWVFLQVLAACRNKYGPPIESGFDVLGTRTASGTTRLEIPQGTTVCFADGVRVGFEPRITSSGRGWCELENVPHPDKKLAQQAITPDVMVLRPGPDPAAVVFDAKYVGRHWVEREAVKIHARYARIRLCGRPVVRHVVAAHPHAGIDYLWAGYGSVPMIPGEPSDLSTLLP